MIRRIGITALLVGVAMWFAPGVATALFEDDGLCQGVVRNANQYPELERQAWAAGFTEGSSSELSVNVLTQRATCTLEQDGRQGDVSSGASVFSRVGLVVAAGSVVVLVVAATLPRGRRSSR